MLNPDGGEGGGGGGIHPLPYGLHDEFTGGNFVCQAFVTFIICLVLCDCWHFSYKSLTYMYCSEVSQRYVIQRRLKMWQYSGFVYKTYMENGSLS